MRRFVRPFLTASIAVAGASFIIAAPVNAAPGTDPNPESGVDDILRGCQTSPNPEACVRARLEEGDECTSGACLRTNPNGVLVGADNPNGLSNGADNPKGLSIGAANQTSPAGSSQNPSPGPSKQNAGRPNGSKKNR